MEQVLIMVENSMYSRATQNRTHPAAQGDYMW
jgi:hypothetical protein